MIALRKIEIYDKYSGEVLGEITQDTRRDLRNKIHKAFLAREASRSTSFEERAALGWRVGQRLQELRSEFEDLMVREAGQPRKFARWEVDRAIANALHLDQRLELLQPRELPATSGRNILYHEPYGFPIQRSSSLIRLNSCKHEKKRNPSCGSKNPSPRSVRWSCLTPLRS